MSPNIHAHNKEVTIMAYKKSNDIRIDTKKLHPWLQYKLQKWIKECNKQGYYVALTQGLRTVAEQDELYAQGRTTKGNIVTYAKGSDYQSQHQWGIAVDFGCPATSNKEFYNASRMTKMAQIAKSLGLAWGGDWTSPVDNPHLYLPKWGDTTVKLKKKFKTLERFKKYWKRKVKAKSRLYATDKMNKKDIKKWIKKDTTVTVLWYKGLKAKVKCGNTVGYMYRSRFKKI